ncbi:hypothetical protein [Enhygromyxa salina]|uniref:Lipoprotein n=1 Tax=Enhygromyxa salina TaxID=215803 RepID=A0A2S9XQS7_9BACT|nr:hypothetical protein [Enhygromyxa salina]PRP95217.1 hypothetical protein ENSA7_75310 [Enhygromyxa salina]
MPRTPRFLVALVLVLGCASRGDDRPRKPATDEDSELSSVVQGDQAMSALEHRLIDARQVDIAFEIHSTGAVTSSFNGTLHWLRDDELSLRATGEFDGAAQNLELRADADTLVTLVDGHQVWTGPRPPALVEVIVLGLTRQGLLHNLAMLTVGSLPEHGDGELAEWLIYVEPQLGELQPFGEGEAQPLEFGVQVADQQVGRATLWLRANGLPIERQQEVEFPSGSMAVVERYPSWVTK